LRLHKSLLAATPKEPFDAVNESGKDAQDKHRTRHYDQQSYDVFPLVPEDANQNHGQRENRRHKLHLRFG
jgi:hypothetical protein